jgi:glycosyltransferase
MISVITVTYNNYEELKATLESIQDASGIESVVVNGGECERSREFLAMHRGLVIQERDRGISDAFNKGVLKCSGSAVAFLNSGDLLLDREYYSAAERELERDPSIAFVYSNLVFVDEIAGRILMKPRENLTNLGRGMPFPHPTLVVRRSVFDDVGLFSLDYRIAMDFDFVLRMLLRGYRGRFLDRVAVVMDGSGVSSVREAEGLQECRRSLVSHGHFDLKSRLGYFDRVARLKLRQVLMTGSGAALLAWLKRLKSTMG